MERKQPLSAVVVIYNICCGDSKICRALAGLAIPGLRVLIYDNSTQDPGNRDYCRKLGWVYLGGTGNVGISKAYNRCVEYLLKEGAQGHVCFFDQDSSAGEAYFLALEREISVYGQGIYAPFLYSANRLLSPYLLFENHRTKPLKNEAAVLSAERRNLGAVNSGMAVSLELFREYRYDENIFLDGVDHSFLLDMRRRGCYPRVIPCRCAHGFSGDERPALEAAAVRFRIYAKDYSYIFRNRKGDYLIQVGRRMLSLTVKYRRACFFQSFMEMRRNKRNEFM